MAKKRARKQNSVYYAGQIAIINSAPVPEKKREDEAIRTEKKFDNVVLTTPKRISHKSFERILKKSPRYRRFAGVTPKRPKIRR
jgi:hypothetical protein